MLGRKHSSAPAERCDACRPRKSLQLFSHDQLPILICALRAQPRPDTVRG
jgi:hypothetical protein